MEQSEKRPVGQFTALGDDGWRLRQLCSEELFSVGRLPLAAVVICADRGPAVTVRRVAPALHAPHNRQCARGMQGGNVSPDDPFAAGAVHAITTLSPLRRHSAQSNSFVPPVALPFFHSTPVRDSISSLQPQRHSSIFAGVLALMRLRVRSRAGSGAGGTSRNFKPAMVLPQP